MRLSWATLLCSFSVGVLSRRLYHVIAVTSVFLNAVVGFFDVLTRVVRSAVICTFFTSRLDKSLMIRGYAEYDDGTEDQGRHY